MKIVKIILLALFITGFLIVGNIKGSTPEDEVLAKLKSIGGAFAKEISPSSPYSKSYEIWLNQPLDHDHPSNGIFQQRIFVSIIKVNALNVIYTEGYEASWPKKRELSTLLNANKIEVEHRYFGVSKPQSGDLQYLTIVQAANDHHRIITLLKPILTGHWISSGKSKGGQCAYTHKALFPNDVDATVSFVAPIMFSREDPRFLDMLKLTLGTENIKKIEDIQIKLFRNRSYLKTKFLPDTKKAEFYLDLDLLLDYSVLNLPFDVDLTTFPKNPEIPDSDSDIDTLISFFRNHVDLSGFKTSIQNTQKSLHYQTSTEIGYYGYPRDHLNEYLDKTSNLDCSILTYNGNAPEYKSEVMKTIQRMLNQNGKNIIYIYGADDFWTACMVEIPDNLNAIRIVSQGKGHNVRIKDLTQEEREKVLVALEKWLEITIQR